MLDGFEGSCKGRRTGKAAGKHAGSDGGLEVQQFSGNERHPGRNGYQNEHQEIVPQSLPSEGCHEGGPAAQPDRVDKEAEAQHVNDFRQLQIRAQRTECQADKKNRCNAQTAAKDFYSAERIADRGDQKQKQERIVL